MEGWKEEKGSLVVLLLAERARSECARPTRAIEVQPGYPLKSVTSELGGWREQRPGALLGRRTRTMKLCSLGIRARHGALRVGRVRMSRAVKGSLGHLSLT